MITEPKTEIGGLGLPEKQPLSHHLSAGIIFWDLIDIKYYRALGLGEKNRELGHQKIFKK